MGGRRVLEVVAILAVIFMIFWWLWLKGQNHGDRRDETPPKKVVVTGVKKSPKSPKPPKKVVVTHPTFDPKVCGEGTLAVIDRETGKSLCMVILAPLPVTTSPTPQPAEKKIRDVCAELGLFGEKFTNQLDEKGRPYCEEDIPWYKTRTTKYVVGTVVVGAVVYCATTGRCWKHGGGGGGTTPTGPSGGGTGIGSPSGPSGGGGGIP